MKEKGEKGNATNSVLVPNISHHHKPASSGFRCLPTSLFFLRKTQKLFLNPLVDDHTIFYSCLGIK